MVIHQQNDQYQVIIISIWQGVRMSALSFLSC